MTTYESAGVYRKGTWIYNAYIKAVSVETPGLLHNLKIITFFSCSRFSNLFSIKGQIVKISGLVGQSMLHNLFPINPVNHSQHGLWAIVFSFQIPVLVTSENTWFRIISKNKYAYFTIKTQVENTT